MNDAASHASGDAPPFFIVGNDRSGTTMLRLILDRSGDLAIPTESMFLGDFAQVRAGSINLGDHAEAVAFARTVWNHPKVALWDLPGEAPVPPSKYSAYGPNGSRRLRHSTSSSMMRRGCRLLNSSHVRVTRRYRFCAAHRLHTDHLTPEENWAAFGKCNNPHGHGHNYVLEVTVRAPIDERTGMVMNLVDLKRIIEERIEARMDHKHLNLDTEEFRAVNPTAENMVVVFWNLLTPALPGGILHELKLYETENNVVVYRGE